MQINAMRPVSSRESISLGQARLATHGGCLQDVTSACLTHESSPPHPQPLRAPFAAMLQSTAGHGLHWSQTVMLLLFAAYVAGPCRLVRMVDDSCKP